MLKPNNAWRWYFDDASTSLMLDLGHDMVFRVAINAKHLIPDAFLDHPHFQLRTHRFFSA